MRQKNISGYIDMQVKGSPSYGLPFWFPHSWLKHGWTDINVIWGKPLQGTEISWIKEHALGLNWFSGMIVKNYQGLGSMWMTEETVWWVRQVSAFQRTSAPLAFWEGHYFFNLYWNKLISNVVLALRVQQSEPIVHTSIYIYIPFQIPFHYQ